MIVSKHSQKVRRGANSRRRTDMTTYWHRHPHGYLNECDLVRCDSKDEAKAAKFWGYDRVIRVARHIRQVNDADAAWRIVGDPADGRGGGYLSLCAVKRAPEYAWGYRWSVC